jgi:hypothetical protein
MRALCIVCLVGCASGASYKLTTRDSYEVGEDPTFDVAISQTSPETAILRVTRPDGSTVRSKIRLDAKQTSVRVGGSLDTGSEPTFTERGDYRVELRTDKALLARQEIRISVDRLTSIFTDEEIADFAPLTRYTRARANKQERWKTYGAIYEHTLRKGVTIHVVVEEPEHALRDAWKPYEEEGTLQVIENNNVRFRERPGNVSASWISGNVIVAMRAETLDDFERGFIGAFLARYPSTLQ